MVWSICVGDHIYTFIACKGQRNLNIWNQRQIDILLKAFHWSLKQINHYRPTAKYKHCVALLEMYMCMYVMCDTNMYAFM